MVSVVVVLVGAMLSLGEETDGIGSGSSKKRSCSAGFPTHRPSPLACRAACNRFLRSCKINSVTVSCAINSSDYKLCYK